MPAAKSSLSLGLPGTKNPAPHKPQYLLLVNRCTDTLTGKSHLHVPVSQPLLEAKLASDGQLQLSRFTAETTSV